MKNVSEDCDDANSLNTDDFLNNCTAAKCGDGVVQTSGDTYEQCDDGNNNNTDSCLNTCVEAVCGDGIVEDGV